MLRMNSRTLLLMPLSLTLLICCMVTAATAQLAQLVSTNTLCRVRLQPPWTGEARQTVITNYPRLTLPFGTRGQLRERPALRVPAELEKLQRELHFDWFTYSDKPSHFYFGARRLSRSLGEKGETFGHSYRASFPTDAQITAATTLSSLTNLLGPTQGPGDSWGLFGETYSIVFWSLFTLTDERTIETLSVSCTLVQPHAQSERQLDSIEVRRGVARQQVR